MAGRICHYIRIFNYMACDPKCAEACMHMVTKGRPAFCVAWPPEKMKDWKAKFR